MNSTFSGHFGYRRLLRVTLPRVASSSDTNETDVRKHLVSLSANQTSIEVSPGSLAKFDDSTVIVEYTRS